MAQIPQIKQKKSALIGEICGQTPQSDQIDVGVLVVDSSSKLGRIATDLIWLRSTLTVPLWVIGLK